MQVAYWARKLRKTEQGPTRHANRGKDQESTRVANQGRTGSETHRARKSKKNRALSGINRNF